MKKKLRAEDDKMTTLIRAPLFVEKIPPLRARIAALEAEVARLTGENAALRNLAKSSGCNLCKFWGDWPIECSECDKQSGWKPKEYEV